jgi:hypothetical protein
MLRRIGREHENSISGAELRHYVTALYKMYARGFREFDMRAVLETLPKYPRRMPFIPLVAPTSVPENANQGLLARVQTPPSVCLHERNHLRGSRRRY